MLVYHRIPRQFPLSVNSATNELVVNTPSGAITVAVLPDEAVANMLAQNVLDHVQTPTADELPNQEVGNVQESLNLKDRNGELVYEVDGTSDQKVLGLFKVQIHKKAIVSAQTGELVKVDKTFAQTLLDLISF